VARSEAWSAVTTVPTLAVGAVQCWLDRLDAAPPWSTLALPPDDEARAARLVAAERRAAFVRGRQLLRYVAGAHLGIAPSAVPIVILTSGKPVLDGRGDGTLEVSLTHTGPWVAIAVSRAGAVGIDIESTERTVDHDAISRRYFAAEERTAVQALAGSAQREAFFRVWARKEAIAKATGDGLAGTLTAFAVPAAADAALPITRAAAAWDDRGTWWLYNVYAPAGSVGALAVRGPAVPVTRLRWG
jgi:4'-phosphopantetheinyl transferase